MCRAKERERAREKELEQCSRNIALLLLSARTLPLEECVWARLFSSACLD
uniref:Uncharacterized protein n=1 Tax=Anguilla anguilla TaxID=7936 RepID=A0A0E9W462_ANGAN